MNKRYKIKCPGCGMEHDLGITIKELKKRYTPHYQTCFDGKPQGKGCMQMFECFIYQEHLVVRTSKTYTRRIPIDIKDYKLETYEQYGYTDHKQDLSKVDFIKYKIVVPTERDKQQIMEAMRFLHNVDQEEHDFIAVNQLYHEYSHYDSSDEHSNIVVDKELYEKFCKSK